MAVLHEALRRLGGPLAERALEVAAGAIRGVAYGGAGTAAIQAAIFSIGLAVCRRPGSGDAGLCRFAARDQPDRRPTLVLIWAERPGGCLRKIFRPGARS